MLCTGPPWDGNSNLMIPKIAAAAAAAGAALDLRARVAGAVLVGEQAAVLVIVVFPPEVLVGLHLVGLRLGGPGRGDRRSVQAVPRTDHRELARVGRVPDIRGSQHVRPGPQRRGLGGSLERPDGGRREQADRSRRGAQEALPGKVARERRAGVAGLRPGAHPRAAPVIAGRAEAGRLLAAGPALETGLRAGTGVRAGA